MTPAEILISVFLILNFLAIVSLCFFSYKLTRSQIKMVSLSRRSQDHIVSMAASAVGLRDISERVATEAKQSSERIQDVLVKLAEWMKAYVGNSDAIIVRSLEAVNLHGARVEGLLVKSTEYSNSTITTIEKLLSGMLKMAESQVHSTKGLEMAITAYTRMSFGVGGNQEKLSPLDEISVKEELRAFMQSSGLPRSAAEREMQRRSVYEDGMRVDED